MKWVQWIFGAALFTASFDLILVINIGGTFRFAQLLLIPVFLFALARVLQVGRILWPRGSTALFLWLLVQLTFLPNSGNLAIGGEFFALLAFTICGYFAVIQLYGASDWIESLMKVYLASYVFVAAFGLVQFLLPILGLPSPLVAQWFIHGKLARINGFCYEPSYFATYLMMGWIMLVELLISKSRLVAATYWKPITAMVTIVLVLSTSKTAWVFMLVEIFARVVPAVWGGVLLSMRQLQVGRIVIPLPSGRVLLLAAMIIGGVAIALTTFSRVLDPTVLLVGTGLANTPSHSVAARTEEAHLTLEVFEEHPFAGRSLGGVPVSLAALSGANVNDRDELRLFWGFPVLLDVLVASGVIGVIPFLIFLYKLTFGALRLARRRRPDERAKWLSALARAMIFEWMLLIVDQNLLRVYLWFHFTMVAVVAYNLEFCAATEPRAEIHPTLSSGMEEAPAL